MIQKILNINISKVQSFEKDNCEKYRSDSTREVAKNWEKEMLRQAFFVKTLTPQLSSTSQTRKKNIYDRSHTHKDNSTCTQRLPHSNGDCADFVRRSSRVFLCQCKPVQCKDNECDCDLQQEQKIRKQCKFVSVEVEMATVACNTSENLVSMTKLTNQNNEQKAKMGKLIYEISLLKHELQKANDESKRKEISDCPNCSSVSEKPYTLLYTPFKEPTDDTSKVARDAESEMIITLQNCKNEVSTY